jgi:peptidyl-prolyl cis-trans isomerase D
MLQGLRDRLSGPFVWFVVGIIVIPFAFFGIDTLTPGGGDPILAKVEGEKIRESQFQAEFDRKMREFQRLLGENFRPDLIDQDRAREGVLKGMVQDTLLREHLRKSGYRATDVMVFEQVEKEPAFQSDGKFSVELVNQTLASAGMTKTAFEEDLRSQLIVDQLRSGILYSTFVPPAVAVQGFRLDQQQRWLAYAVFEAARYMPQVQVSDAQVQERYEQQAARFQAPERLRVAYVELALDQLEPAAAPEAEVLKAVYEAEKNARFTTIEERHARHILVNFGADKAKARERIEMLADKLAKGADFTALAASDSDDPGTKAKGGDLGWVRRGQMLEKFEQSLFELGAGEVSAPVETEFGFHLIRLEAVREPQTRPFDEPAVQAELLQAYRQRDAERRYQELSEKLEQTAFESPASLEPAAKAAGLAVQTSDWLTRTEGPGLFAIPAVREAAFAEEVLQAGENSRPVTVGENHIVVLRKQDYEAPRQRPLEEVAPAIREVLKVEGARARAAADATEALAALEQGRALEQIVTQKKAQLKAPGLVRRTATEVDPRIVAELFTLPRPAEGGASRGTVAMPNGDVAVVVTTAVQDGDWAAAAEADRAQQSARLRESYAGAEFTAYVLDLEKRSKIEYFQLQKQQPAPDPAAAD